MKIKGSDIRDGPRSRLLITRDQVFSVKDLGIVSGGSGVRRLQLFAEANGKNAGIIYSDQLKPGVLGRLNIES